MNLEPQQRFDLPTLRYEPVLWVALGWDVVSDTVRHAVNKETQGLLYMTVLSEGSLLLSSRYATGAGG